MKNVILVHGWNTKEEFYAEGKDTASNDHWFPWLTKELMVKGYKVDAPEMTQSSDTTYESWKKEFQRFDINSNTVLIGHSLGCGFIIRWLSESDYSVNKVVLVAPWMGIDADSYAEFDSSFFDFELKDISDNVNSISIFYSDDDDLSIRDSVKILRARISGIEVHKQQGKGHYTLTSLGTKEFPDLLQEILHES